MDDFVVMLLILFFMMSELVMVVSGEVVDVELNC